MQALFTKSSQLLTHALTDNNQGDVTRYTWQSMWSQHNCPCCSYGLLRHIRNDGIYWRCSHCYQEMPVLDISKCITSYTGDSCWSSVELPSKHQDVGLT